MSAFVVYGGGGGLASGGGGGAPPSITGTVAQGETLTATGAGPYQWKAGGVAIVGETASTYTVDRADGGYWTGITCEGAGGVSNTLRYLPALHWRDVLDVAAVTPVGGGIDALVGAFNTFTAPAAGNRPAYSASTAAFANQPTGAWAGGTDYLLDAMHSSGGAITAMTVLFAGRIDAGFTAFDRVVSFGNEILCRIDGSARLSIFVNGTGGGTTTGTTAFTTTPKVGGWSWTQNGNRRIWLNGTAEATGADTSPAKADNMACSIGASTSGTVPVEMTAAFFLIDPSDDASKIADATVYMRERFGL